VLLEQNSLLLRNNNSSTQLRRASRVNHSIFNWFHCFVSPCRRTKAPMMNFPEFAKAFKCRPGRPMNPLKKCAVWWRAQGTHLTQTQTDWLTQTDWSPLIWINVYNVTSDNSACFICLSLYSLLVRFFVFCFFVSLFKYFFLIVATINMALLLRYAGSDFIERVFY